MKSNASAVNSSMISSSWIRPAAITSAEIGAPFRLVRARKRGMSSVVAGM